MVIESKLPKETIDFDFSFDMLKDMFFQDLEHKAQFP